MSETQLQPKADSSDESQIAPLLQSMQLTNFLSFGPDSSAIPLGSLNILIGPNGAGKSNLIEAISFLRAAPVGENARGDGGLQSVVRRGGGVDEWIWKGRPAGPGVVRVNVTNQDNKQPLHHGLFFTSEQQRFRLKSEHIEDADSDARETPPVTYYGYVDGSPAIRIAGEPAMHRLTHEAVESNISILAQRNDPEVYPEVTYLAQQYKRIALYRDWSFGRMNNIRESQRTDSRVDRLEEDFSNLGLFLNRLSGIPKTKRALVDQLRDIYDGVDDFHIGIFANTVQIVLNEGSFQIPSTRLSDGTLRYLCLLAILLDPTPPPLICLEEPELGLHPDLIHKVADLLVEASRRTQLIVTAHSDIIVDSMTPTPECILICEKHDGQTQINRLAAEDLALWLDRFRLGELWTRGQLGGTRW